MKNWLIKKLFAAEFQKLTALEKECEQAYIRIGRMECDQRPARFRLDGGMPEEEIAERLAGTAETPVIQAIVAELDRKIIQMSDRATGAPSDINTPELRTYEAGGANAIAEFKSRIADLTATREEQKPAKATT
jgi:hypothetical protein